MIPAVDPGIRFHVRNEHPADLKAVSAGRILLYVHGAADPSETAVKDVGAAVDFDKLVNVF
jgi:hypothetical protein